MKLIKIDDVYINPEQVGAIRPMPDDKTMLIFVGYNLQVNCPAETVHELLEGKKSKPKPRFIPPTLNEVLEYCRNRVNYINPQVFIDFYESKNWMVGKSKMKDWKAAVRTWEKNNVSKTDKRSRSERHSDKLRDIAAKDIRENGFTEIVD